MTPSRLTICAAALVLMSAAAPAQAEPAYVSSTVNLRSGASTSTDVVAKIPGGSLVDVNNCTDWCEVTWQDKKGYAIATALDRSGRVPSRRTAAPRTASSGAYVEDDEYVPVGPPAVYAPAPYYYGYGYRPYWGYRSYGYGYRRGWHRW